MWMKVYNIIPKLKKTTQGLDLRMRYHVHELFYQQRDKSDDLNIQMVSTRLKYLHDLSDPHTSRSDLFALKG